MVNVTSCPHPTSREKAKDIKSDFSSPCGPPTKWRRWRKL